MNNNVLLIGNLTLDHNISNGNIYDGPGGTVYFAAKTFHNLGFVPTVISPYGKDFSKYPLEGCNMYPSEALYEKTLTFKNIYLSNGERKQEILNTQFSGLGHIWDSVNFDNINFRIVIVAPILDNISGELMKLINSKFPKSLKVLLPQGFYRRIDENGKILPHDWKEGDEISKLFDIIVVSEKDWYGIDKMAGIWSNNCKITVVTKESKGCSVYQKGKVTDFGGYIVDDIVDSTGSGDVFAAAFSFMYSKSEDIGVSADFGNATAALSLRYHSNQLQYSYSDIISFIKNNKRREIL